MSGALNGDPNRESSSNNSVITPNHTVRYDRLNDRQSNSEESSLSSSNYWRKPRVVRFEDESEAKQVVLPDSQSVTEYQPLRVGHGRHTSSLPYTHSSWRSCALNTRFTETEGKLSSLNTSKDHSLAIYDVRESRCSTPSKSHPTAYAKQVIATSTITSETQMDLINFNSFSGNTSISSNDSTKTVIENESVNPNAAQASQTGDLTISEVNDQTANQTGNDLGNKIDPKKKIVKRKSSSTVQNGKSNADHELDNSAHRILKSLLDKGVISNDDISLVINQTSEKKSRLNQSAIGQLDYPKSPAQLLNHTFAPTNNSSMWIPKASQELVGEVNICEYLMGVQVPPIVTDDQKIQFIISRSSTQPTLGKAVNKLFQLNKPFVTYDDFTNILLDKEYVEPKSVVRSIVNSKDMRRQDYIELLNEIKCKVNDSIEEDEIIRIIKDKIPDNIKQNLESSLITLQAGNTYIAPSQALALANNIRLSISQAMVENNKRKLADKSTDGSFKRPNQFKRNDRFTKTEKDKTSPNKPNKTSTPPSTANKEFVCWAHKTFKKKANKCLEPLKCKFAHQINNVTEQSQAE